MIRFSKGELRSIAPLGQAAVFTEVQGKGLVGKEGVRKDGCTFVLLQLHTWGFFSGFKPSCLHILNRQGSLWMISFVGPAAWLG